MCLDINFNGILILTTLFYKICGTFNHDLETNMNKILRNIIFLTSTVVLLSACSANSLEKGAENVMILDAPPAFGQCKLLGEVIGSQGNWLTGGYTTNTNLLIGARNDIRNETYKLGGDSVYIQVSHNTQTESSAGTSNATLIGNAYKCNQ